MQCEGYSSGPRIMTSYAAVVEGLASNATALGLSLSWEKSFDLFSKAVCAKKSSSRTHWLGLVVGLSNGVEPCLRWGGAQAKVPLTLQ